MSIAAHLELRALPRTPVAVATAGAALTSGLLLAWMYSSTAQSLIVRWQVDPAWSHGYAVVAVFPFLLCHFAKQSGRLPWQPRVLTRDYVIGLLTLTTGLLWHFVGRLGVESLDATGLVIVLVGLVWVLGGRVAARAFSGSVLFLLFMVPWPFAWQQPVAESLQHLVAVTSHALLSLGGVPIHRAGYLLLLPGQTVEVAEGCSGLRQITVFVALSVFLGLIGGHRGRGWALVALSLPIAILANTLRIASTVVILLTAGPAWAKGIFHECEGLVTFSIGLGLLWIADNFLKRVILNVGMNESFTFSRYANGVRADAGCGITRAHADGVGAKHLIDGRVGPRDANVSGLTLPVRLAGLTAVLATAAVLDGALHQAMAAPGRITTIAMQRPLAAFPTELGDWSGADTPVENSSFLYGDEHLHRVYRHRRTGQTLTVWMIYTEDGRDRSHHPEVCLRAIGCVEERDQRAALPVDGHDQPVQRFFFRNSSGRAGQWVYYWYYVFREATSDQPPTVWQRLLEKGGRMRSGMTVEIFAPQLADGDAARTDDFTRQLDRVLQAHLPDGAVRGSLRGSFLMVGDSRIVDNAPP